MSINHTTPKRAEQILYVLLPQSDTHKFCGRVEEHCSKETLYLSAIEILVLLAGLAGPSTWNGSRGFVLPIPAPFLRMMLADQLSSHDRRNSRVFR